MKILAFADLHGRQLKEAAALIHEHQPDWIVLLGDILPDFAMVSGLENRLDCQRKHWQSHAGSLESSKCPTTFIRGNHELEGFQVPERHQHLPIGMEERVIRLEGIPSDFASGDESRASTVAELEAELRLQIHENPGASIVLSHVPPHGYLDEAEQGVHIGHKPLAAWLESRMIGPYGLVLCGHVHESFGIAFLGEKPIGKTLVVNLAGGYAVVAFQEDSWKVQRMETMDDLRARQALLEDNDDMSEEFA